MTEKFGGEKKSAGRERGPDDVENMSDNELAESYSSTRDEVFFAEIFNRYKDQLINFLSGFTKDYTEAEDRAMVALEKAGRAILENKYSPQGANSFRSWLIKIARNEFFNLHRQVGRQKEIPLSDLDAVNGDGVSTNLMHFVESGEMNPEDRLIWEQKYEIIKEFISGLKEKIREPILLYNKGYQYDEIADQLNIPIGTVKSRISKARKEVNKWLASKEGSSEDEI